MRFKDRRQAGRALAMLLTRYRHRSDTQVFALGRSAVPVAYEVARALDLSLAIFGVCKLALPHRPDPPFGALASGGALVIDREVVAEIGLPLEQLEEQVARHRQALRATEALGGPVSMPDLTGVTGILVDEGLSTPASMQAALLALRTCQPERLVMAVPVASLGALRAVEEEVDEVVCVLVPPVFDSLGLWYEQFGPVPDAEARTLLRESARERLGMPLDAP